MSSQMIEKNLQKFIDYLLDIGLISGTNVSELKEKFNKFYEDKVNISVMNSYEDNSLLMIYFKDNLSKLLLEYFNELSEEKKKLSIINFISKYFLKTDMKYKENAEVFYDTYYKFHIKQWFIKWKNSCNNIDKNNNDDNNKNNEKFIEEMNDNKENLQVNYQNNTNSPTKNTLSSTINNNTIPVNNAYSLPLANITNIHKANNENNSTNTNNINYLISAYKSPYTDVGSNDFITSSKNSTLSKKPNKSENFQNQDFNYYKIHPESALGKDNVVLFSKFIESKLKSYTNNVNNSNSTYKTQKSPKNSKIQIYNYENSYKSSVCPNSQYLSNLSRSKKNNIFDIEKTTEYLKEQEELKNCSFKPKINNYHINDMNRTNKSERNRMTNETINRLYTDNKCRLMRREINALNRNKFEANENTFKPKFISKSLERLQHSSRPRSSSFDTRLALSRRVREAKLERLKAILEAEFTQNFTFVPNVNSKMSRSRSAGRVRRRTDNNYSKSNNNISNIELTDQNSSYSYAYTSSLLNIPVYQRLYDDSKKKVERQEKREMDQMREIMRNANMPTISNTYNKSYISNNDHSFCTPKVDHNKIEELYNDYKKKKIKLTQRLASLNMEQGVTFHPQTNSFSRFSSQNGPSFLERERDFLDGKRAFVEAYGNYLFGEATRGKGNLDTLSRKEKIKVEREVVKRLYEGCKRDDANRCMDMGDMKNEAYYEEDKCIMDNRCNVKENDNIERYKKGNSIKECNKNWERMKVISGGENKLNNNSGNGNKINNIVINNDSNNGGDN